MPVKYALFSLFFLLMLGFSMIAGAADVLPQVDGVAWWLWPLGLFVVCFFMGIVAVPAGVGGGVLFV
ncbi:MAG: hypothetical protein ACYDCF_04145, partial [Burkholderiales bacterium]